MLIWLRNIEHMKRRLLSLSFFRVNLSLHPHVVHILFFIEMFVCIGQSHIHMLPVNDFRIVHLVVELIWVLHKSFLFQFAQLSLLLMIVLGSLLIILLFLEDSKMSSALKLDSFSILSSWDHVSPVWHY